MKNLQYTTIASDNHSIQVSTWKQPVDAADPLGPDEWCYKFTINGKVIDQGVIENDTPIDTEPAEETS